MELKRAWRLATLALAAACAPSGAAPSGAPDDEPDASLPARSPQQPATPTSGSTTPGTPAPGATDAASAPAGAATGSIDGRPGMGATATAADAGSSRDLTPEPEPAVKPDPIPNVNAGAVTALNAGNEDQAPTNVTAISGGAGMALGMQGTSSIWKWRQPGAFLEYSVRVTAPVTYAVSVVYYAAQSGGRANVSVNGTHVGSVTFASTKEAGGYGGIPTCCSRAPGVPTTLMAGVSKIRVTFAATSLPVDVQMIQVNHSGALLPDAGKVTHMGATSPATITPQTSADFYRNNYSASSSTWPCAKSFSLVGYNVEAERAGAYEVTVKYRTIGSQCSGVGFVVDAKPQTSLKLTPGSGVTPPAIVQLPAGPSRLTLRNPNYVGGEFCGFGATFGEIVLKPLP